MKISKLKLRGAIGIKKGLGLDEIEIDFTAFSSGLIALSGRNGSGKTTIMENLHPYRMMVSREGSLQGHFFLKDSCRILSFEYEGSSYESKILIDAVTGGSEAYLYKDGTPLNDGKLTTYDEALQNLLGSPELFFNSVFCGQKAKGVAELKPAERRALFYELLNLNLYQAKCEAAKDRLKEQQGVLSRIETEIAQLQNKKEEYEELEERKSELLGDHAACLTLIATYQTELTSAEEQIRETELQIARLQEKKKQNEVLGGKIIEHQRTLADIKAEEFAELKKLEEQEKAALSRIEADPEYNSRLNAVRSEIERNISEGAEKARYFMAEGQKLSREFSRIKADLEDVEKLIGRAEKLASNKSLIAEKLNEKKELSGRIETLQEEYRKLSEELSVQSEVCTYAREKYKNCSSEIDGIKFDFRQATGELERAISRLDKTREDCEILGRVPCDFNIGKSCQFVTNAFEERLRLPELEGAVSEWQSKIFRLEDALQEAKQKELECITESHKANESLEAIKRRVIECNSNIAKAKMDLDTLNREGWEDLEKEAAEADTQMQVLTEKKASLTEAIERNNADLQRNRSEGSEFITQTEEKRKALEQDAEFLVSEHARKIADNERIWAEKRDFIAKSIKTRVDELQAVIESLLDEIYNVNLELPGLKSNLEGLNEHASGLRDDIMRCESSLKMIAGELNEINAGLKERAAAEDKLEKLLAEKAVIEQEVKDYAFLVRAFDKTGIPVLKLENSGIEITALANELLSIFDNKFRIVIETTRLKANKKDLKETFDINVVEDDGMCEISNKSGGQQVWLETAIQLAISRVVRQQGRNIQTAFLDEKDGALDLENAFAYYEMLQKNHELSGVYNTFVITHRPELLEYIPQQVRLKDGVLEILN